MGHWIRSHDFSASLREFSPGNQRICCTGTGEYSRTETREPTKRKFSAGGVSQGEREMSIYDPHRNLNRLLGKGLGDLEAEE